MFIKVYYSIFFPLSSLETSTFSSILMIEQVWGCFFYIFPCLHDLSLLPPIRGSGIWFPLEYFSLKSCLVFSVDMDQHFSFLFQLCLNVRVPPKIKTFVWCTVLERLDAIDFRQVVTLQVLLSRYLYNVQGCKQRLESHSHLLHFPEATCFWSFIYFFLFFCRWDFRFLGSRKDNKILWLCGFSICWCIWTEKNANISLVPTFILIFSRRAFCFYLHLCGRLCGFWG